MFAAEVEVLQDFEESPDGDGFKEDHRGLHREDGGGDGGDEVEEGLCDGWVDGVSVEAAVDVVEDGLMRCAKEGQRGIAGDVAVGRDVSVLDDAVPDVAVDVGGEIGLGEKRGDAGGDGKGEDDREGEAVDGLGQDQQNRGDVEESRKAGGSGEADGEVVIFGDQMTGEKD